ncbi:hypothetical protein ACFX1R_006091 [Malus domestica]
MEGEAILMHRLRFLGDLLDRDSEFVEVLAVKQELRGVGELGNRGGEKAFGQGLEGVELRRRRLVHGHGV